MHSVLEHLGLAETNSGACHAAGQWSGSADAGIIESVNPATAQTLARVHAASATDYESVVTDAVTAAQHWRRVPAPVRGEVVRRIGDALRASKDALGSLVAMESGKIKTEGDGEVQEMIDIADFAVGQSRMLYGKTMHSERPHHRLYEQWHPLGAIGVISAFNFPVAVWSWNAFIAAVCGDTVIWKPSPKTALCAIAVQHICNRVLSDCGHPGVFNLFIPAQNDLVINLVKDPRLPLISFTGSSAVGRKVGETVAARMGKSLLELSGNNAIIVDESADLKLAIPAIVFGAVGTAGQRCTSTRRLFVHESCLEEVSRALVSAYGQVRIGDPLDADTLMGPLIDAAAVDGFQRSVAAAREAGGELLYGGKRIDRPGYFVEPTLIRARNDWPVVQTETFGPLLYVMGYKDFDDAIALQNNAPQGLSSSLFSNDLRHVERFLSAGGSDCGLANVNAGTSGAEIGGAFGGEKDTGGGREAGSDSWKAYMRRQTNTINWGSDLPLAQGIRFDL
ncbi:MAG: aldehyde dehydrogenase family protein [Gammaproteobacteria bacterium]|nr:aldehyde dehydrogenase family protein [Gammaproteobacteria bacterium]